jgi:transcription elongation GreA/GreB family factor
MMDKTVWMTADGYQKLQARLAELHTVKRPALVKELQDDRIWADVMTNGYIDHALEMVHGAGIAKKLAQPRTLPVI